jgi:hypothetical protein
MTAHAMQCSALLHAYLAGSRVCIHIEGLASLVSCYSGNHGNVSTAHKAPQ